VFRFFIVGVSNTALNFVILNAAFYGLKESKLVSSFIATTCAMLFSFFLNRNFVFVDRTRPIKQLVLFIVVTVSGVLLVQNTVYALFIHVLHGHESVFIRFGRNLTGIHFSKDFIDVNLSNAIASVCVMFWSYNGYRLFVFKDQKSSESIPEEA
jgi:putative flippase GtrA